MIGHWLVSRDSSWQNYHPLTETEVTLPLDLSSAQLPYWSNNSFIKLLNFNTSISIPVKCYTFFYYTYLGGLDILVFVYGRSIWISIFLTNDSVQVAIKQEINVGLYDIVLDSFFQTLMRIFVITLIMEIDHNQQICISYALNLMPTPLSAGECSVAYCGHRHVAYWLLISQAKSYVDLYVHTDIKIKKSRTRKEHMCHLGTFSIYSVWLHTQMQTDMTARVPYAALTYCFRAHCYMLSSLCVTWRWILWPWVSLQDCQAAETACL